MAATDGTPRPIVFRNGLVLTMDDAHTVLPGGDVLVVGDRIAEVGVGLDGSRRRPRDRRLGRHRHAGHGRHPPAPVADRDARLRRRLDPDPVLRLVLPRVGQDLPPRGHPRGQPAGRRRGPRRRRDHDGRLVARAAQRRSRGRRGRRARGHSRPLRARLRQHPGRPVELVDRARSSWTSTAAGSTARATGSASSWPSTSPATRSSRSVRRSRSPASSTSRCRRTPGSGGPPATRASSSSTTTGSPTPRPSTCTRRRCRPTPTIGSPRAAARCRCPPRVSRAPGRATHPPG